MRTSARRRVLGIAAACSRDYSPGGAWPGFRGLPSRSFESTWSLLRCRLGIEPRRTNFGKPLRRRSRRLNSSGRRRRQFCVRTAGRPQPLHSADERSCRPASSPVRLCPAAQRSPRRLRDRSEIGSSVDPSGASTKWSVTSCASLAARESSLTSEAFSAEAASTAVFGSVLDKRLFFESISHRRDAGWGNSAGLPPHAPTKRS